METEVQVFDLGDDIQIVIIRGKYLFIRAKEADNANPH